MSSLNLKNLSKSYGDKEIIKNINLEINGGKMTSLVGHSGAGKSTLLRIIAGLERNNMIYGPHASNDLQYFVSTNAVVNELSENYPDSIILLKLYPCQADFVSLKPN